MSEKSNLTLLIEISGCISFKIVCQGLILNGFINWNELMSATGKALFLLFTSNTGITPTFLPRILNFRVSMGAGEGFKDYAQKWRGLAGRVQPPLSDRELVDMFLGTLSGLF